MENLNKNISIIPFSCWPVLLILTGTAIRLRNFIHNRALWLDEATLSLNIIHRDYRQLLEPLDTLQIAPIGFLYVEKFFTQVFGISEYS